MLFDRACPKVNHSTLQGGVIGQLDNNLLGNPAKVETPHKPRMNSDRMSMHLVDMVRNLSGSLCVKDAIYRWYGLSFGNLGRNIRWD